MSTAGTQHSPQILEPLDDCQITWGSWQDEKGAESALDAILEEHASLWTVYREVPGRLIQPTEAQVDRSVRIDRVLTPKAELIKLGWDHGAIGIECKRSGEKIGPAIAQAIDYSRSAFCLPSTGVRVFLNMVFIWPMSAQHGALASILYQQRVGSAYSRNSTKLRLKSGEAGILRIGRDGVIEIGNGSTQRKVGCR